MCRWFRIRPSGPRSVICKKATVFLHFTRFLAYWLSENAPGRHEAAVTVCEHQASAIKMFNEGSPPPGSLPICLGSMWKPSGMTRATFWHVCGSFWGLCCAVTAPAAGISISWRSLHLRLRILDLRAGFRSGWMRGAGAQFSHNTKETNGNTVIRVIYTIRPDSKDDCCPPN